MRPALWARCGLNGMKTNGFEIILPVQDYDLDATLASGQVFGWERGGSGWTGVASGRWVELTAHASGIRARVLVNPGDWNWLRDFLQTEVELAEVIKTFPPDDAHLQVAVEACRGLRLLRQDPWECLASFILSSTKQIVQIRQIVQLLRSRFGTTVKVPVGVDPVSAFPTAAQLAVLSEADLRACKMGFRAPYLLAAARRVAAGEIDLAALGRMDLVAAQQALLRFDGVGEKIADCVLLFAYGFPEAFPVDVWVRRVLVNYYFRRRQVSAERLRKFVAGHFGPNSGYAQQYLFHYIRTIEGKKLSAAKIAS